MYDHLGGGFHRYSVDEYLHVPHVRLALRLTGGLTGNLTGCLTEGAWGMVLTLARSPPASSASQS